MQEMKLPKLRKIDPNKPKKKKILLLSDDLRMHSGIATMSREFVMGTSAHYDWVRISAAVKHPDEGKIFDVSKDFQNMGVKDASVKIYPVSGYGNPNFKVTSWTWTASGGYTPPNIIGSTETTRTLTITE